MQSRSRRGFTLVEAMIVVAILAIGALIAALSIQSSRERITLDRATAEVRAAIEHARGLASIVGSRSVDANAPGSRLVAGPNCGYWAQPMEVVITPGANAIVQYPASIQIDAAGVATVTCTQWPTFPATNLQDVVQRGSAATLAVTGSNRFAFLPSGRVVGLGGPSVLVRITSTTQSSINGFRILPSGVLCQSSETAPAAGFECDDNPRF